MLNGGSKTRLLVRQPLPIHITYLTAWIDPKDQSLHYGADIYGRDSQLMAQLHPIGMMADEEDQGHDTAKDGSTAALPATSNPLPPS
jgi:hypothetical protein